MKNDQMLTDKEYDEAANALIDWFKSQDIKPVDGAKIMIKLMATQLVAKTTDLNKLQSAISNISIALTCDVVLELKFKK